MYVNKQKIKPTLLLMLLLFMSINSHIVLLLNVFLCVLKYTNTLISNYFCFTKSFVQQSLSYINTERVNLEVRLVIFTLIAALDYLQNVNTKYIQK